MNSREKISLLEFLRNIESASSDQILVNRVIETTIKVSVNCISKLKKTEKKYFLPPDESIENLAVDAVAPLFVKDENNRFFVLKNSFNSWNPPVQNEDEAVFFLNRIVTKRVTQHLSHYLREIDPFFGKILDSVNYRIDRGSFVKTSYFGTVYIQRSIEEDPSGEIIDSYVLESFPGSLFNPFDKSLLDNLFRFIEEKTEFFPAVPLNALIYRIKGIYMSDQGPESGPQFSKEIETDELLDSVLSEINSQLVLKYVNNGKLSIEESKAMLDTVNEIVDDLKEGGASAGLYEYLKLHMEGLCKEEYRERYQNILEYLVKVIKSKIAVRLENF